MSEQRSVARVRPSPPWMVMMLLFSIVDTVQSEIFHAAACPGKEIHLYCAIPGQKVIVHEAYYGEVLASSVCDMPSEAANDGSCAHPDPWGSLARTCFQKSVCKIAPLQMAEVFNYQDPCPGLERYLTVTYNCVYDYAVMSICENQNTAIERPNNGYIKSQNYPDPYNDGKSCRRTLKGQAGQVISIALLDLDLEYSDTNLQCYDFVVFHQRKSNDPARKYCGTRRNAKDVSFQYSLDSFDEITVSFESSIEDNFRGFLFEYKVTGCPTAEVPEPPLYGFQNSFSVSTSVQYGCNQGYELISRTNGLLTCHGVTWLGDPGYCFREPTTTSSTTLKLTTLPSTSMPTTTITEQTTMSTLPTTTTPVPTSYVVYSTTSHAEITTKTSPTTAVATAQTTTEATTQTTRIAPTTGTRETHVKENTTINEPNWVMDVPKGSEVTTTSKEELVSGTTTQKEGTSLVLVAAIAGTLSLVLVVIIIIAVVVVRRKLKKKRQGKNSGLSSLRPSAHACVSIPNTYAGVGYAAAKSASYSSSERNSFFAASSSARNSSSRNSSNPKTSSDEISYESEIYERARAESLKGSADPILTNSETSFDCVEVKVTPRIPVTDTTYLKPVSYTNSTTSSQAPLVANPADLMDSDLLYPIARPSLETIREENEGESTLTRDTSTFGGPNGSTCSSFNYQRQEADGHSNASYHYTEEESRRSIDSDSIPPKVELRRIRTRPVSMGEADQPESKRRIQKVEYGLFKDDDTGNLDNFLDERRVSV